MIAFPRPSFIHIDPHEPPQCWETHSILYIGKIGEGISFHLPCKRPNIWWRFWSWLFFGFQWQEVKPRGKE